MHQLGLTLTFAVSLSALAGCRTSEPAQGAPPASATSVAPPIGSASAAADAGPPPAAASAQASAPPLYDETSRSVDARAGDQFVVVLPANTGTPFKWRVEPPPDATVVTLVDRRYSDAPPKDCAGCTGYGGTDAFTFLASGAGTATLHFAYAHVGKHDSPPSKEVAIAVHVTAK